MRPLDVDAYYARLEREHYAAMEPGDPCDVCGDARCADPDDCEDARRWALGERRCDAREERDEAEVWDAEDVCPI